MLLRLQKFMAESGVASRRRCEKYITEGRVEVNGEKITAMGKLVDPKRDRIVFDDRPLSGLKKARYIMLHKPGGYITSCEDPLGRPTVMDLLGEEKRRIFPVGRLDRDVPGLLLLTNDGWLTLQLTHPRYGVEKGYEVFIHGRLKDGDRRRLEKGVELNGKVTAPARVKVIARGDGGTNLYLYIHEGRKHQVKRMFHCLGYRNIRLSRVSFGPLSIGNLKEGEHRSLKSKEIIALYKEVSHCES